MLLVTALATFLAVYASGPAGKQDRVARARRLNFPRALALKGSQ